ncbi:Lrp/AsnC family transcriptional regulator [Spiractinospora alimapuensis]|uniref:Lrp/AsnC family transcriptional regulator n=1 Tax=Spiractinospora alimapuensis TaxID=2820884 RepID=UPI001F35D059|nr:Lrp/AsnC family transcriptional regulator [Spiractinospora alimapuensis]QVQ54491.1 Lrp/AsnC family transcriptional regulator [Spiractinospora alimapuensis]
MADHALSELDRRIVAALQLDGRSPWSEIARRAGTTESTAARRAGRLIEDGVVRVVGVADPQVCGLGQPVLVQLACPPTEVRSVADALETRPDIRFLTICTGEWDVVAEVVVPGRDSLGRVLVDELGALPGVHQSSTAVITRNFKMRHDWSSALLADLAEEGPGRRELSVPTQPAAVTLDDTDRHILAALADDGRRSHRELAEGLDIGETGVRRRVNRLLDTRALVISTVVDPAVLGFELELIASLKVDLARLGDIAARLADHRQVRYVSATAGSADLVCEAILPSFADIYPFTTEVLGDLPGVQRVDVGVELENRKRAYRPFTSPSTPARGTDPGNS